MNPNIRVVVPQEVLQRAVNYLITQPYKDVSVIIADISNNTIVYQEPKPEPDKSQPKASDKPKEKAKDESPTT